MYIFIIRIDMAKRMFHINIYKCVDYNLSIFKSLFYRHVVMDTGFSTS